jgi:hypothetical protein
MKMKKVLRSVATRRNSAISEKQKKQDLFRQALSELKKESGIDHYKLITGDDKEKHRLKFKQFQERLLEG